MSNQPQHIKTQAIPFITYKTQKGFTLNTQAKSFIQNLPQHLPISIISIAGKYRTGKSFFVNRVLLNSKQKGFKVGNTINPCTKGLWLWRQNLYAQGDRITLLVDTQGFGGMDQHQNHDSRIFLFSLLISSYFIYNSVGSIDQNALNTLSLVLNMANQLVQPGQVSDFPDFLWIVRDFSLQIVDKQGKLLDEQQYLQKALEQVKGSSQSIKQKNNLRRLIKKHFKNRQCRTMVRPVQSQKQLQKLNDIPNSQLRPQFINQVKSIRNNIFSNLKTKTINKHALNGKLLISLIQSFIDNINKGTIPNIDTSWNYVRKNIQNKAYLDCLDQLSISIDNINYNDFQNQFKLIKNHIVDLYTKKCYGQPNIKLRDELIQSIDQKISRKQGQIRKSLQNLYETKLAQVFSPIECLKYDSITLVNKLKEMKVQFGRLPQSNMKWQYYHQHTSNFIQQIIQKIKKQQQLKMKVVLDKHLYQIQQINSTCTALQQKNKRLLNQLQNKQQVNLNQSQSKIQQLLLQINSLHLDINSKQITIQQQADAMHSFQSSLLNSQNNIQLLTNQKQHMHTLYQQSQNQVQSLQLQVTHYQKQIQFFKQQLKDSSKMQQNIISAFGSESKKNQNQDLIQTNKSLITAIDRLQVRNKLLQQKCCKLKQYKKIVKSSQSFICSTCKKIIPSSYQFYSHMPSCTINQNNIINKNQPQKLNYLSLTITQTVLKQGQQGKPYTQYIIQASTKGNKWTFIRKYKEFCELHRQLQKLQSKIPDPKSLVTNKTNLDSLFNRKKSIIGDRHKNLQQYLRQITRDSILLNSQAMRRFISLPTQII